MLTMYLDDTGDFIKCDRCGAAVAFEESAQHPDPWDGSYWDLWREVFRGRQLWRHIGGEYCKPCARIMTPWVFKLRDVDELQLFVNKLGRAINEKRGQRNKDNGAA